MNLFSIKKIMVRKTLPIIVSILLMTPSISTGANPSSTNYRLPWATIDNGVSQSSSASYSLKGSVAQTSPVGISDSTNYSFAGGFYTIPDSDADSIVDFLDNCLLVDNPSQIDTDGDNIGNACDCDLNQDNFCGGPDFTLFIGCFNQVTNGDPICEAADMNGDNFVGGPDFTLFIGGFNAVPGPSGK
jgi:hypothetical protein